MSEKYIFNEEKLLKAYTINVYKTINYIFQKAKIDRNDIKITNEI